MIILEDVMCRAAGVILNIVSMTTEIESTLICPSAAMTSMAMIMTPPSTLADQ